MAQVEYGPLITKARGSVRGSTFSRVISGETVRGRPHPPLPGRPFQFAQQRFLANAAAAWPLVSPANKILWTAYASSVTLYNRLNQAFTPTGQMMFARRAVAMQIYGLAQDPPYIYTITDIAAFVVPPVAGLPATPVGAYDLNTNNLRLASWTTPPLAGAAILFSIYKPSTSPQASRRFFLKRKLVFETDAPPITLAAAYSTAFPATTTFHVKLTLFTIDTNGRVSNPSTILFTLTKP
jgi:hypothetical protein